MINRERNYYDIYIPQWKDGRYLLIESILAENETEAKTIVREKLLNIGSDVPISVMEIKACY